MRLKLFGILTLFFLITGCAQHAPFITQPTDLKPLPGKPIPKIRVGISDRGQSCEFTVSQPACITTLDGDVLLFCPEQSEWKVIAKSGVNHFVVAGSMSSEERAQLKADEIRTLGLPCFIVPVEDETADSSLYRVYIDKEFQTEIEARQFQQAFQGTIDTFLDRRPDEKGKRIVLLNMTNGDSYDFYDPIQIRNSDVTLRQILVGEGYHWERKEDRTYPEIIELRINNSGQLQIINVTNLQIYLMGVVPSEMPQGFPLEALKAQAIAARSEAYAKLGNVHHGDPYDLCADVHCQVYSGLSRRTAITDRAVRETRGMVLWYEGQICDAVYSSVCGGHSEHNENAWSGSGKAYLRGTYDGSGKLQQYGDLRNEINVENWLNESPDAYCNTADRDVPDAMNYTKKYFRWEVKYDQTELRQMLMQKTGQDVGGILGLIPVKRGVSGRIMELKVTGENGEFSINGELRIRKALSASTLWSSCFYVKKQGWENGLPKTFILKGAGFGHGVGMCQTGAGVMALKHKKYDEILKHYYQHAQIKRMY